MIHARLNALREWGKAHRNAVEAAAALKADPGKAKEVRELSKLVFNETVKGCSNCLLDYYTRLMAVNPDKVAGNKSKYMLKAGAVLWEFGDTKKTLTQRNMSDELAEHHLRKNPKCAEKFQILPSDWQKLTASPETDAAADPVKKHEPEAAPVPEPEAVDMADSANAFDIMQTIGKHKKK